MFPRFDKLTESEIESNAALLQLSGFSNGLSAAQTLTRIRALWLEHSKTASEQRPAGRLTAAAQIPHGAIDRPRIAIADAPGEREILHENVPGWYLGLERILPGAPLPDTVISVIEQFIRNTTGPHRSSGNETDPFELFEKTPRALDVLARTACTSPFLTQTLLADPDSLSSLLNSGRTAEMKAREQFVAEAESGMRAGDSRAVCLSVLRNYQRRELLRIGMCDAFGLLDLRYVTLQLSLLADAVVQVSLNLASRETGLPADLLTVIAMGKHGGEELNYSSDIDLILIVEKDQAAAQKLARLTVDALTENVPPGFLYRVDLRLRPWGDAGPLVCTPEAYASYLKNDAALWERQALLKARTVAGDFSLGRSFLQLIRPLLFRESGHEVRLGIQQMKERIEQRLKQRGRQTSEVKLGAGNIRDIEFLVQYLQLVHGRSEPRVLSCNTLESLVRLAEFGLLSASWYRQLRAGYVFLRTVEHSVQLLHNLQTHELPPDPRQMAWLAHRLDYPDAAILLKRFEEHRFAVRSIFEECLGTAPRGGQKSGEMESALPGMSKSEPRGDSEFRTDQLLIDEMSRSIADGELIAVKCLPHHADKLRPTAEDFRLICVGAEFPNWLSKICGLLAIYRLDIRYGEALVAGMTSASGLSCPDGLFLVDFHVRLSPASPDSVSLSLNRSAVADTSGRRESLQISGQLHRELSEMILRLCSGKEDEVRSELLTRFCEVVEKHPLPSESLTATHVEVSTDPGTAQTRLDISGRDTCGFLYELSHALSLSRFRITRAAVDCDGDTVRDVLFVTEREGEPVTESERLQELRVAVALIGQFTHWLPSTSNPRRALQRFRELIHRLRTSTRSRNEANEVSDQQWLRDIQSLQKPDVLQVVARMLGIGQYLWEEFLKSRHEELFPVLANASELAGRMSREELAVALAAQTQSSADGPSAWAALNQFKDRHLFRIDMRHVMGHCRPFGAFSEEITELAEVVVSESVNVAWRELSAIYGQPLRQLQRTTGEQSDTEADQQPAVPCRYMIAGLGKFGGIEMGYASDIELILIYESSGQTDGPERISNARFFDLLVAAVASGISARQDGIFHVDLRMRPFGTAGSSAVLLNDFGSYYSQNGPAWPYERQALVKFRCVAGDREFGSVALSACHDVIYSSGSFDFASMKAMRERQIRQLVRGGSVNVKLSDGGLVDCEYAVQAIQLAFGGGIRSLRHPNTRRVIREAAHVSLIAPEQSKEAEEAYVFLRQLIDCLRMVRGNAKDLTIPDAASPDFQQLDRRLMTIHDSKISLADLETQMQIVRRFSQTVEKLCRNLRPGWSGSQ